MAARIVRGARGVERRRALARVARGCHALHVAQKREEGRAACE
jgi:hypothetical protein